MNAAGVPSIGLIPSIAAVWPKHSAIGEINPQITSSIRVAGPEGAGVQAGTGMGSMVLLFFMPIASPIVIWPIHTCHIRESFLDSFLLSMHHFFLLPLHLFFVAPTLLFLPELQLLLFLHVLVVQLYHPLKFLKSHQILLN